MEWKSIEGFDAYEVSNTGIVRSRRRMVVKHTGCITRFPAVTLCPGLAKGYHFVALSKLDKQKLLLVHRLVAIAFIPNPLNKSDVNHNDGDKLNNNVSNLSWMTRSENMKHAYATGLRKSYKPKVLSS